MKASSPGLGLIADRMRWLQARTRVLSENIANVDTPRFAPRDLAPQGTAGGLELRTSNGAHLGAGSAGQPNMRPSPRIETRPGGNAVSVEDEMLKLSETQLEYQMIAGLYQRGLATLRTAIGRRG